MHDAIVVGAGQAGAAAAYDLARAGHDVVLLDRRRFPREKACAGAVSNKALNALRFSIAPVIREVAAEFVVGRGYAHSTSLSIGQPICALTVRSELDAFCLEKAIGAGADFRVVRHVDRIAQSDAGVTVSVDSTELSARYVIAADGANSTVRRLVVGSKLPSLGFALEATAPKSEGSHPMECDFGVVEFGYGWVFPKGDHLNIGLYTNSPRVRISRDDVVEYARRMVPGAELSHFTGHHIGLRGWEARNTHRRVLFAGDAAGMVDPLLGEGIYNAIATGQAAARAVIEGCRGADAARSYRRALRPLLDDVRVAYRSAMRFYNNLSIGYLILISPLIRYALMKGYASGLTYTEIKRLTLFMPLVATHEPAAIKDWRRSSAT